MYNYIKHFLDWIDNEWFNVVIKRLKKVKNSKANKDDFGDRKQGIYLIEWLISYNDVNSTHGRGGVLWDYVIGV